MYPCTIKMYLFKELSGLHLSSREQSLANVLEKKNPHRNESRYSSTASRLWGLHHIFKYFLINQSENFSLFDSRNHIKHTSGH